MHYHLEVVMPPSEDVNKSLDEILCQFSEQHDNSHTFWDWFQVGGRYSGSKIRARIGQEKIDAFVEELQRRKVTVSGLQWGKQKLSPDSQIASVDSLWREMCPNGGEKCLLFKHAGDELAMDICKLSECPKELKAYRIIIAAPDYRGEKLEAVYMRAQEVWNGVTHEKTDFNGTLDYAMTEWNKNSMSYKEEYRQKIVLSDDWLVVTIDYHS